MVDHGKLGSPMHQLLSMGLGEHNKARQKETGTSEEQHIVAELDATSNERLHSMPSRELIDGVLARLRHEL